MRRSPCEVFYEGVSTRCERPRRVKRGCHLGSQRRLDYYSDRVERHALLGLVGPATVQCNPEDPTATLTLGAVHGGRKAHCGRFTWPLHCSRLAGAPPDPIRPPTCCFTRAPVSSTWSQYGFQGRTQCGHIDGMHAYGVHEASCRCKGAILVYLGAICVAHGP